eukprot:560322-Rhodomonas_salina.4
MCDDLNNTRSLLLSCSSSRFAQRQGQSALDEILLREDYVKGHEEELAIASKIVPQVEFRKRCEHWPADRKR